jgi:hypothetical protein
MQTIERSAHSRLLSASDLDERIAMALPAHQREDFRRYRREWLEGIPAQDRAYPLQIDWELNASCNLRCPMCTRSEDATGGKDTWLSLEHFRSVMKEAVAMGTRAVGLNGVNEPLIRKDLPDFVACARELGVLDILLHSNGVLLTRHMSRRLIDAGLTRLFVSLDAVNDSTYRKIRVGADLNTVLANIQMFREERVRFADHARTGGPSTDLPVLGVCFIRMKDNADEEEDFIRAWRPFADFFSMQSFVNPWPDRPEKGELASLDRSPPFDFKCAQPFQRMRVRSDGAISPCCAFQGDHITVGSTHQPAAESDGPIAQAWKNGMIELRHLHREGRYMEHRECARCVSNSYVLETEP